MLKPTHVDAATVAVPYVQLVERTFLADLSVSSDPPTTVFMIALKSAASTVEHAVGAPVKEKIAVDKLVTV